MIMEILIGADILARAILLSLLWLEARSIRACLETMILQSSQRRQWAKKEHGDE